MTTTSDTDAFAVARGIAPDFAELLQVPDLADRIADLKEQQGRRHLQGLSSRNFFLGDAVGMAGLLASPVGIFSQIRAGHTFQGTSEEQIKERLILKLSAETSLPVEVRECLITRLIEKLPPHG